MASNVQERVQNLLNTLVRDGSERGIQVAAYHDGKLVVDAWAGIADADTGRAVDGQTLFPVFSVTKGMATTLLHLLVERGQIDYDTRIASVWPEFAAMGKSEIRVRHALNHTSGLHFMPMGLGYRQLNNWDVMCAAMAAEKPAWPAGTRQIYQAVTFSWLVGEVVHRVSGQPFSRFLHQEICQPLGLSGMFVGIPDAVEHRVVTLYEIFESGQPPTVDDSKPQTVAGFLMPLHTMMNRPDARRACIPASNGIMNARSIARHYAALLPGGVDGIELLPRERIRQATQLQSPTHPDPADAPMCMALGWWLGCHGSDMGTRPTAFGHGGYGGSIGFADPEYRLAVGLTKNQYSKAGAGRRILNELREALRILQ